MNSALSELLYRVIAVWSNCKILVEYSGHRYEKKNVHKRFNEEDLSGKMGETKIVSSIIIFTAIHT